jgi:quercetin dioxygenase-like cupin family protein
MRRSFLLLAPFAVATLAAPKPRQGAQPLAKASVTTHIMLAPSDLAWGECSTALPPGAQCAVLEGDLKAADVLFGYRVKFPDGYRIAPHFHPADEHVLVVSGTFHMGTGTRYDAGAMRPLPPGGFAVMPKGAPHFARTEGETIVHVYAIGPWGLTYVDAADDPRRGKGVR